MWIGLRELQHRKLCLCHTPVKPKVIQSHTTSLYKKSLPNLSTIPMHLMYWGCSPWKRGGNPFVWNLQRSVKKWISLNQCSQKNKIYIACQRDTAKSLLWEILGQRDIRSLPSLLCKIFLIMRTKRKRTFWSRLIILNQWTMVFYNPLSLR